MAIDEMEKEIKDPEKFKLAKNWYESVIPTDRPILDELHGNVIQNYRDMKTGSLEKHAKFGSPLSTGERGIIHHTQKPKPD